MASNTDSHSSDREEAVRDLEGLLPSLRTFFRHHGARSDYEDLAHEVIWRVISRREQGEVIADLPQYALRVAHYVLSAYRRQRTLRLNTQVALESEGGGAEVGTEPEGVDDDPAAARARLEVALSSLTPEERALLLRYYGADRPQVDALARELGISRNVLMVRISRLRWKVRDLAQVGRGR